MATSKGGASEAGRLLQNPTTPTPVERVAGSDLAQRKPSKKRK